MSKNSTINNNHANHHLSSDSELTTHGGHDKISSALVDIFSQNIESIATSNTSQSVDALFEPVLRKIITYGTGDIVSPLKKHLGRHASTQLSYKDIQDITFSLQDLFDALNHVAVKNNIPTNHDIIIAKTFVAQIQKTVSTFDKTIQDIYENIVVKNNKYIDSLDTLSSALKMFFDTCIQQGCPIKDQEKNSIKNTLINFADIERIAKDQGFLSVDDFTKSHKSGVIASGSFQEQLLNTHMTLFGVSTINAILDNHKQATQRLDKAYNMTGISTIWNVHNLDDETLSKMYPAFDHAIQSGDNEKISHERFVAMADYMSQKGDTLAPICKKLIQAGGDFSKLSSHEQEQYISAYKDRWISTNQGKDLIEYLTSFGVDELTISRYLDKMFSLNNETITVLDEQGEEHTININKTLLTDKKPHEYMHLLETHGLPFALSISGDVFDDKDLKKLHTKKQGFYAGGIPHALTLLVGASTIKSLSSEEVQRNIQDTQDRINNNTFNTTYDGIDNNLPINESTIDNIDWLDKDVLTNTSVDELQNAKRYYQKNIDETKRAILHSQSKEKQLTDELKILNDTLYKTKNIDDARKSILLKDKAKLEQEIEKHHVEKNILQESLADMEQKRETLAQAIKHKQQQQHQEALAQAETSPETTGTVKPVDSFVDKVNPLEAMTDKWNSLQGDKKAKLEVGSSICIELADAESPLLGWKKPWAIGKIIRVEGDGTFEIQWKGIDMPLGGKTKDGKSIEGSISTFTDPSGLEQLQQKTGGKLWKFGKYGSWESFGVHLKEHSLDIDKEQKDYLTDLLDKIDFGSMYRRDKGKTLNDNPKNKITYVGGNVDDLAIDPKGKDGAKTVQTLRSWYEVKQEKDGVLLSGKDRDGNSYSRKMSPEEFIVFMTDKGLQTYTQHEVDEINKERTTEGLPTLQDAIDRSHDIPATKKRLWTNLKSIAHCWKFGLDGVKKRIKEKQGKDDKALENAMLTSKWFKSLSGLPIIGEAFEDMYIGKEKELDGEKTKEIKEASEEPEKNGEDTKKGPYEYILGPGKFKEVAEGGTLTKEKDIRKFAGYYCYMLSKRTPYGSVLTPYAGKGVWVRGLLGLEYQKQYLTYIKKLQDAVEKNPNDAESKKNLAFGELGYLKKVYGDGSEDFQNRLNGVFGKAFFTKTLGSYDAEQFSTGAVEDKAKEAKGKLFNEAKGDFAKAVGERRFVDMYGTLKGMGENIKKDPINYSQWMMRLAYPILAGITVNNMDDGLRGDYEMLAKQFLSPYGMYAKEADGPRKLWELFGIASEYGNIGSNFLEKFAEFMPTATEQRPTEDQLPKFLTELDNWWFYHGNALLDIVVKQPGKLLQIKGKLEKEANDTIDLAKKQQLLNKINLIKSYVDKKVLDDSAEYVDSKLGGIVAENHVINFSPGTIQQILNYKNGTFNKELVESGPKAWKALSKQIKLYDTSAQEKASPDLYRFVLKKFIMFFESKGHFGSSNLKSLLAALKYADKPDAMTSYIMHEIDPQDNAPKEVKDTIIAFQDFIKNNKPDEDTLAGILDDIIGKGTGNDYRNIQADQVKKTTKKDKDQLRTRLVQDIMKDVGINVLVDGGEKIDILKNRSGNGYCTPDGTKLEMVSSKKNNAQGKNTVQFNILDNNGSVIKTLTCYDFKEDRIQSYDKYHGLGGDYYNPFEGFGGFE